MLSLEGAADPATGWVTVTAPLSGGMSVVFDVPRRGEG